MMRVLIVDDETLARQELAELLQELGGTKVIGSCANAIEALKIINRDHPEVVFLDIQMPVIGGFELLSMIDRDTIPQIVFVTAYDEFALKAFEEEAFDYLLKPVDRARLQRTLEKLSRQRRPETVPAQASPLLRIPCASGNRVKLIDIASVEHVRSDLSGVHIVTPQQEYFTELTLKVLEERTPLIRCHRQYLINLDWTDEVQLLEHGLAEIRTRADHHIPVSRHFLKQLKDLLNF